MVLVTLSAFLTFDSNEANILPSGYAGNAFTGA
jgi:hypothetical protein